MAVVTPVRIRDWTVFSVHLTTSVLLGLTTRQLSRPNIAQLVERSTVEIADIEWSLVRFRVFGLFLLQLRN